MGTPTPPATPPTTPPASPNAAQNTTEGTQNQRAIFDNQMFLLDAYASLPDDPRFTPLTAHPNVPVDPPFEKINDIINTQGNAISKWIHDMSPIEYAQISPKFQLFVVNMTTKEQTEIPLITPSNINDALSSPYFYTTKSVGLKSIDMQIDGNTTPVTGKIYNIDMVLIFDSVNTFFDLRPGVGRYCDIFRRQGSPGDVEYTSTLKLAVSYTGPPDIVTKYGLDGAGQAFSVYLTLINSNLEIKENLQTEVKVKFQGYTEALIKNNTLFDFIKVDIEEARGAMEREIAAAAASRAEDTGLLKSWKDIKVNEYSELMSDGTFAAERQTAAINALASEIAVNRARVGNLTAVSGLLTNNRRGRTLAQYIMQAQRDNTTTSFATDGRITSLSETGVTFEGGKTIAYGQFAISSNQASDLNSALSKAYREGNIPPDRLRELQRISNDSVFTQLGVERPIGMADNALGLSHIKNQHQAYISNVDKMYEASIGLLRARLQEARSTEIQKSLQELLFKPEVYKTTVRTYTLTADEFKEYQTNALAGRAKEYFVENAGNNNTREAKALAAPQRSDLSTAQKAVIEATRVFNAAHAKVVLQSTSRRGTGNDQAHAGIARRLEEERTKAQNKLNTAKTALQAAASTIITDRSTPQFTSIAQLEAELNNKKPIDYILLGDLLARVMIRLEQTSPPTLPFINAAQQLQDTFIILTQLGLMQLPSSNQTKRVNIYNIPISVLNLEKMLTDKLYGNFKNTFTLFELFNELVKLIGLAQKRKSSLLQRHGANTSFTINYNTGITIATDPLNSKSKKNGIITVVRDNYVNLIGAAPTLSSNRANKIPHFFFGGYTHGAVKSVQVKEIKDGLANVAFSRLQPGDSSAMLPAIFEAEVKLVGTVFFQLGMYFFLDAPTVNINGTKTWFHLQGWYSIKEINHTYSAGGDFTTTITGVILESKSARRPAPINPADVHGPPVPPPSWTEGMPIPGSDLNNPVGVPGEMQVTRLSTGEIYTAPGRQAPPPPE